MSILIWPWLVTLKRSCAKSNGISKSRPNSTIERLPSPLQSISGVGQIMALTILYEIGDINRFESVQKFASYSRLVKCKAESAGKILWHSGQKIGNAHLKWAFSEIAVLYFAEGNGKGPALPDHSAEAEWVKPKLCLHWLIKWGLHLLSRGMLKNQKVFDEIRFLGACGHFNIGNHKYEHAMATVLS